MNILDISQYFIIYSSYGGILTGYFKNSLRLSLTVLVALSFTLALIVS